MPSTDIVVATSRKDGRDTRFVLAAERDLNSCNLHVRARCETRLPFDEQTDLQVRFWA
jgi:hypothetical protein